MLISTQPIIKKYLDFVAGVSALAMPSLRNQAIKDQLDNIHVMVYGEYKAQLWNIASCITGLIS
jgi:hypothetical protein